MQAMEALDPPRRFNDHPLRITIHEVHRISQLGVMPVGRIESGILKPGMKLKVFPGDKIGLAKVYGANDGSNGLDRPSQAYTGTKVGFPVEDIDITDVPRGCIVSCIDRDPVLDTIAVVAQLTLLRSPEIGMKVMTTGYLCTMEIHLTAIPVKIMELQSKIDRRNGQLIEENPRSLKHGDSAVLRILTLKSCCVEAITEYPTLSKFSLKSNSGIFAVGFAKQIEKVILI
jgi:elongation factor 1-alpha